MFELGVDHRIITWRKNPFLVIVLRPRRAGKVKAERLRGTACFHNSPPLFSLMFCLSFACLNQHASTCNKLQYFLYLPTPQAYELRSTADPVMRESVTETCLVIHPVQFWSVGISFVDDSRVLKILAWTSLSNTFAHYRVCGGSQCIGLLPRPIPILLTNQLMICLQIQSQETLLPLKRHPS